LPKLYGLKKNKKYIFYGKGVRKLNRYNTKKHFEFIINFSKEILFVLRKKKKRERRRGLVLNFIENYRTKKDKYDKLVKFGIKEKKVEVWENLFKKRLFQNNLEKRAAKHL